MTSRLLRELLLRLGSRPAPVSRKFVRFDPALPKASINAGYVERVKQTAGTDGPWDRCPTGRAHRDSGLREPAASSRATRSCGQGRAGDGRLSVGPFLPLTVTGARPVARSPGRRSKETVWRRRSSRSCGAGRGVQFLVSNFRSPNLNHISSSSPIRRRGHRLHRRPTNNPDGPANVVSRRCATQALATQRAVALSRARIPRIAGPP